MRIVPVDHGLDIIAKPDYQRGAGLHMSDIYNALYKELEPKRYGGDRDQTQFETYVAAGLALEERLEEGLRDRLALTNGGRPDECVDVDTGILYSPDLILFNGVTRLGEIKLTWMSSREVPWEPANGFPVKFDKYFTQMKAYCRCLETPHARLMAYFVNGDYRPPRPELLAWDITFTPRELHENWTMLINFAKLRRML